eukprot:20866-Heterococcus_DN1.PRE.2
MMKSIVAAALVLFTVGVHGAAAPPMRRELVSSFSLMALLVQHTCTGDHKSWDDDKHGELDADESII